MSRREVDLDDPVYNSRVKYHQARGFGGPHRHAGFEIEMTAVQRADHRRAGYDAIAEGTPFVRAGILNGKKAAVHIENCNLEAAQLYGPSFARRNIFRARDLCPLAFARHTTVSIASI